MPCELRISNIVFPKAFTWSAIAPSREAPVMPAGGSAEMKVDSPSPGATRECVLCCPSSPSVCGRFPSRVSCEGGCISFLLWDGVLTGSIVRRGCWRYWLAGSGSGAGAKGRIPSFAGCKFCPRTCIVNKGDPYYRSVFFDNTSHRQAVAFWVEGRFEMPRELKWS